MTFSQQFREHVGPRLRQQIEIAAFRVACGVAGYGEARDEVSAFVHRYGGHYLPAGDFDQLHDWISARLLRAILASEPRVAEMEAENQRQEEADPFTYYEGLAAGSTDPERMRWTFAAISPAYRHRLLAVRRERA